MSKRPYISGLCKITSRTRGGTHLQPWPHVASLGLHSRMCAGKVETGNVSSAAEVVQNSRPLRVSVGRPRMTLDGIGIEPFAVLEAASESILITDAAMERPGPIIVYANPLSNG